MKLKKTVFTDIPGFEHTPTGSSEFITLPEAAADMAREHAFIAGETFSDSSDSLKMSADSEFSLQSSPIISAAATKTSVSKVYQHWADGDAARGTTANWNNNILSDGKSDYFEGEVIPHVFAFKASNQMPLVNGQSYSFNITYNYYQANTNAGGFAFITSYDISRDPADFVSGSPIADNSFTNGGGIQGAFSTIDANITEVSAVTYTGSGTKDGHVTVTFTYTGPTTTSGFAEIYYGLMIASPGQIPDQGMGTTDGANAWTGGSLQTTVDIGGSGATSIQLAPSAIIVGEISGMKFNDINGDGVLDTNGVDDVLGNADDEVGLAGWTIFVDKNGNGSLDAGEMSTTTGADGTYTLSVSPDADKADADNDPYLIREVAQAGWTQTTANPAPILITSIDPTETGVDFGNMAQRPSLTIDKTFVNVTGGDGDAIADAVGDVLNYNVRVTNTGNVTLTGVTVQDPLTGQNISGVTLAPGAFADYASSYTLTQADLDGAGNAGSDHDIDNTATADSNETDSSSDSETVPLTYAPALAIDKTFVNVTGGDGDAIADAVGDVLNYNVRVTNTGNVTLTGVTVQDPLTGQNISGVTLAPGAFADYASSYTLTQADLDGAGNAGSDHDIDNTATADSNETDSSSDSETVPLTYAPALTIDKTFVNVTGGDGDAIADAVGDVLNYNVRVTNTGNVTLTGVTVQDPLTGQNISGVTLAPGAFADYASSYTLTQADLDGAGNAGSDHDIDNTATADSNETDSSSDSETVPLTYAPALTIDKTFVNVTGGDGDAIADAVGDVLNYNVRVTNTGNVTLTGVTVQDPLTGQNISGVTLAPGAFADYASSYTLTQADLDGAGNAGSDHDIDNTATADSNETDSSSDSETVPLTYAPALTIDKTFVNVTGGDGDAIADAVGDVLNYNVRVTNTGNVTLTGVTVQDPLTGQNISGVTLAPGAFADYASSYTLTQADLDGAGNAGSDHDIDNTATADSNETDSSSDSETVPLTYAPALTIDKTFVNVTGGDGDAIADAVGDVLNYNVRVTNTGNVTLTGVTVQDPLTGQNISGVMLAPGAFADYASSYTLTQADLDGAGNAGSDHDIDNTATADSNETDSSSDSETVPLVYDPAMNIVKTAFPDGQAARFEGDQISYSIAVENTGNVTLTGVTVVDTLADAGSITLVSGDTNTDGKLDVDETWIYSAVHTVTQAELNAGGNFDTNTDGVFDALRNVATADSNETGPDTDDAIVPVLPPVTFTGSPYYNFPNSLEQIQAKGVSGPNTFFINSKTFMMWDFYTKDTTLASISLDPATYGSGYAGLTVSVAQIWESDTDNSAVFRVYVANETDAPIQFNANTDVVYYDIIGDSKEKGIIDLINGDPLNGNFNNFSNIENAITSNNNGFVVDGPTTDFSSETTTVKFWASTDPTGVLDNETPVAGVYQMGSANDLVYLRNNPLGTTETVHGNDGDDLLLGRDGSDILYGDNGNDWLFGSLGSDTLYGGAGSDRLFGSYGHDQLTGGSGADVFLLRAGDFDTIHDFNAAEGDTILIWWESRYDTGILSGGTDFDTEVDLADPIYDNTYYDAATHLLYLDGTAIAEFVDVIPVSLETRATDPTTPEIIIT